MRWERRHAGQFSLEHVHNPPKELRHGVIFSNGMHLEMETEFEEAAMNEVWRERPKMTVYTVIPPVKQVDSSLAKNQNADRKELKFLPWVSILIVERDGR